MFSTNNSSSLDEDMNLVLSPNPGLPLNSKKLTPVSKPNFILPISEWFVKTSSSSLNKIKSMTFHRSFIETKEKKQTETEEIEEENIRLFYSTESAQNKSKSGSYTT